MAVTKIVVGYRTRAAADLDKNLPEFKAPSNYKDSGKIAADIADRQAVFKAGAKDMPYTGTFDEIHLVDPKNNKVMTWTHKASEEEGKPSPAVRARNFLHKYYPTAWNDDTHGRKQTEVVFLGFDPRTFLKLLGLECSMPVVGKRCHLSMWYSNADHRDIGEAVIPKDFKGLTLPYVLKFRRPVEPERMKLWDSIMVGWTGPGEWPEKDALITIELATQLGLLED